MKLSEAILLGSVGTRQAFMTWDDGQGGTCAWGAAFKAAGISYAERSELPQRWPVTTYVTPCPVCGWERLWSSSPHQPQTVAHRVAIVGSVIVHLNDYHKWTRPRIAEWVATVEQAFEAPITLEAQGTVVIEEDQRVAQAQ